MKVTYPTFKFRNVCSPTNGVSIIDKSPCLKVRMTCGGGMGGCEWYEYIKPTELISNSIIDVVNVFGEKKQINTRYVVKVEEQECLIVEEDKTPWRNYDKKVCDSYITRTWFSIHPNQHIQILDKNVNYDSDTNKDNVIATANIVDDECVNFRTY